MSGSEFQIEPRGNQSRAALRHESITGHSIGKTAVQKVVHGQPGFESVTHPVPY